MATQQKITNHPFRPGDEVEFHSALAAGPYQRLGRKAGKSLATAKVGKDGALAVPGKLDPGAYTVSGNPERPTRSANDQGQLYVTFFVKDPKEEEKLTELQKANARKAEVLGPLAGPKEPLKAEADERPDVDRSVEPNLPDPKDSGDAKVAKSAQKSDSSSKSSSSKTSSATTTTSKSSTSKAKSS